MKKMKDINLLHFMVWVSLIPPIPLFIVSYIFESQNPIGLLLSTSEKSWFSVLYVGYISTLVAFSIWGWLLKEYHASTVTPFALLIPVVGIISSSFLLNESLSSIEILGTSFNFVWSRYFCLCFPTIKICQETRRTHTLTSHDFINVFSRININLRVCVLLRWPDD
ncbi:EamA family transporter [Vibrio sp. PP-XX7]